MGKDKTKYGVSYGLMDGNYTQGNNLYGYCKAHQGLLSYPLARVHRCCNREEDGSPCRHLILFDRIDNRYQSELKGEAFRESLGKKGRKGGRKKYQEPNTMPKVAELSETERLSDTVRSVEQIGDLPSVSEDSRLEADGVRNKFDKDRCNQCFWRKMYGRVVQAYVCAGRGNDE